uniref:Uncharacterized protein n=1 Tax=Anguilla anguilla TaxID=7936 RepID=A0A0E9TT41_ANGAN
MELLGTESYGFNSQEDVASARYLT